MDEQVNPNEENNKDDLAHLEFDSLSPLEEDAANMHELFLAFVKAGFTEDQALKLIALMADQPDVQTVNFHFEGDLSEEIIDDLNDDE